VPTRQVLAVTWQTCFSGEKFSADSVKFVKCAKLPILQPRALPEMWGAKTVTFGELRG
jgi:hypothetical protein